MAFFQGDDALLHKIYNEAINRKKKLSQSKMGEHLETDLLPLQKDVELTVQLACSKALKEAQSTKVQIMLNEDDEFSEVNSDENL